MRTAFESHLHQPEAKKLFWNDQAVAHSIIEVVDHQVWIEKPPSGGVLFGRLVGGFPSFRGEHVSSCAGFRTPGCRDHPHARTAGVRKASRHEIAGCGAPTVQRVLWGFGVGVSVGEVEPTLAIGSL